MFAQNNDLHDLLPRWLDGAGYRTAWIGKYLNGTPGQDHFNQPDWSYFAVPVHWVYDYGQSRFAVNGRLHRDNGYRESYTRRLLLSHVRTWSRGHRPFFVLYSALAPHKSWPQRGGQHPPMVQSQYRHEPGLRLVPRPSVGETDLSDKPQWLQTYAATHGIKAYPRKLETRRVESLLSVNETVHRLVSTLKEEHALNHTVVMFTSDNGFMLREHDVSDKNKAYEESLHVPLVVRGPGFRGGYDADQTVSLADVTATVRRVAGVTKPHGADGVPLQDVLASPGSFDRRPIEIEGSAALYPGAGASDGRDRTLLQRSLVGSLLPGPLRDGRLGVLRPDGRPLAARERLRAAPRPREPPGPARGRGTPTTSTAEAPPATTGSRLADRPGRDAPPPTPMAVPGGSASPAPGCSLD